MPTEFRFVLTGRPARSADQLDVTSPFDGSVVGRTWLAGAIEFETVADAAVAAASTMKDSGLGREGPKYTIEEMTEPRLLVINRRSR